MLRQRSTGFANSINEGIAGAAFFYSLSYLTGKLIEGNLFDFFMDPHICKDPYFMLQKGNEKEHSGILFRFIEAFLIKCLKSPFLHCLFFPCAANAMDFQCMKLLKEKPCREIEDKREGDIPPYGIMEKENRDQKGDKVSYDYASDDLGFMILAAFINDHDSDFTDSTGLSKNCCLFYPGLFSPREIIYSP